MPGYPQLVASVHCLVEHEVAHEADFVGTLSTHCYVPSAS